MDIVQDVEQMCMALDQDLLRAALEKRPDSLISFVEVVGIADIDFAKKEGHTALNTFGKQQVIMILHQHPAVNIDEPFAFPRHIWIYDIHRFEKVSGIRIRRCCIVEFVKIMDESNTVAVIHEEVSSVDAAVEHMPKFHTSSVACLWIYDIHTKLLSVLSVKFDEAVAVAK